MDVFRAVALGRPTLFDCSDSSALSTYVLYDGVFMDGRNQFMKGADPALILFLARTSNLTDDMREGLGSPGELQREVESLEREILAWEPSPTDDAESVATSWMWKEVHGAGSPSLSLVR